MKKYLVILFLFLSVACELIVDVDVPFKQSQLTLNAVFTPDSVWTAEISLNRHILDDKPFQRIENALIVVYDESAPADTLRHHKEGIYKSTHVKPSPGKTYEIRVSAPDHGTVKSSCTIPFPAPITHVEVETTTFDNQPRYFFKIKLKDDARQVNYYQVLIENEYEWVYPGTETIIVQRRSVPFESTDPTINNENYDARGGLLIKDLLFNGKETELSFQADNLFLWGDETTTVSLRTVSEEYYKYMTTSRLQDNTSDNPFAQPVNVFSNIEQGFGIFAGYSQSSITQSRPRPIITGLSATQGKPGDEIVITGENFSESVACYFTGNSSGVINWHYAQIVERGTTYIKVIVPQNAVTGKIYIRNGGKVAFSDTVFQVTN